MVFKTDLYPPKTSAILFLSSVRDMSLRPLHQAPWMQSIQVLLYCQDDILVFLLILICSLSIKFQSYWKLVEIFFFWDETWKQDNTDWDHQRGGPQATSSWKWATRFFLINKCQNTQTTCKGLSLKVALKPNIKNTSLNHSSAYPCSQHDSDNLCSKFTGS